jgi:uncharacterized protein YacL
MKEIRNSLDYEASESNSRLLVRFKLFALRPIIIGLFAFSIFFTTILVTKVTTYLLVENSIFNLNIHDVLFSLIGFALGFLIEFLLQIRLILFME